MIAPIDPDHIVGRTLIGAEAIFAEVRDEMVHTVSQSYRTLPIPSVLQRVRSFWEASTPVLVDHLADSNLSAWIGGMDNVAKHFPPWLWNHFTQQLWGTTKEEPPTLKLFPMFGDEPKLRLPIIERAATNLFKRNVMTRPQWDAAIAEEQQKAFFITADLGAKAIEVVRDALVEDIAKGGTLRQFKQELSESMAGSTLGPAHLENIYRTNIQAAYRDGKETLASNPIVANLFPYCRYIPIHDGRTRSTHAQLGRLGLNGTGIYRRDDPFWNFFTPPWGYQCRCGTQLMTIEAAARAGVQEAKDWLKSGRPPANPEWRLEHIPFPPEPGFGGRGIVRMSVDRVGHQHKGKGAGGGQFTSNGGGDAGGKSKPKKNTVPKATITHATGVPPEVVSKAAEVGNTPEHVAARQHVAKHYYENKALSYDRKTNSMVRMTPDKVLSFMDGIDFSHPVVLGPPPAVPPPVQMVQWQAEGGYRGSFFSIEGVTPQELGIYEHATAWTLPGQPVLPRSKKAYDTRKAKLDRVSYLKSITAPTLDTWSVPDKHVAVAGGGVQWHIPVAAHPNIRIPVAK